MNIYDICIRGTLTRVRQESTDVLREKQNNACADQLEHMY